MIAPFLSVTELDRMRAEAASGELRVVGDDATVVVYDDAGGVIAARLVWMLRTLGESAAVLDGGLAAWQSAHPEQPLEVGADVHPSAAASPSTAARAGEGVEGASAASRTVRPWPAAALATIDEAQTAAADTSRPAAVGAATRGVGAAECTVPTG